MEEQLTTSIREALEQIGAATGAMETTESGARIVETPHPSTVVFRDDQYWESTIAALAPETAQQVGLPTGASPDEAATIEFISPRLVLLCSDITADGARAIARRGFQSVYGFMYTNAQHEKWLATIEAAAAAEKEEPTIRELSAADLEAATVTMPPPVVTAATEYITIGQTRFYSFGVEEVYDVVGITSSMLATLLVEKITQIRFPGYRSPISRSDAAGLFAGIQSTGRPFNEVIHEIIDGFRGFALEEELTTRGKIIGGYRRQVAADLVDLCGVLVEYDRVPVAEAADPADTCLSEADVDGSAVKVFDESDDESVADEPAVKVIDESDDESAADEPAVKVIDESDDESVADEPSASKIPDTIDAPEPSPRIAAVALAATVFVDDTAKIAIGRTNKRTGDKYELAILYKFEEMIDDSSDDSTSSSEPAPDPAVAPKTNAEKEKFAAATSAAVLRVISAKPRGGYRIRAHGAAARAVLERYVPADQLAGDDSDVMCWVPVAVAHRVLPFLAPAE